HGLSFSPDGQRLAVCGRTAVEVWNVRDLTDGMALRGHSDGVLELAFVPGQRQLLSIANIPRPDDGAFGGPSGTYVPLGGAMGVGGLSGSLLRPRSIGGWLVGPEGIARLNDQPAVRWALPAWELKRWDVDGGFTVTTLPGHTARLTCAAFAPKADRLAV